KTIAINPDYAHAHYNIGVVFQEQSKFAKAVLSYEKAIAIKPDYAQAHNNLGAVLHMQGYIDKAIACFNTAISLKPDYAQAYYNLAFACQEQGQFNKAISCYQKALAINPDYVKAHSSLIFCLDLISDINTEQSKKEREKWAKQHAKPLQAFWTPFTNTPDPERKLRIGYVGADFNNHSAANIFGPMLLNHDPNKFQIYCYAGNEIEDEVTEQFKKVATKWCSTNKIDDVGLAQQIKTDGIDILVDLASHSQGNRLLTFARKPAPIQVTAWGYPHGTAMEAMDYLFADPIFIPKSERKKYTEKIVNLPNVIHLSSDIQFPEINPPPITQAGYVTFGAFNRLVKYNESVYRLWSEILHAIPTAKLLIKTSALDFEKSCKEVQSNFKKYGILPKRLILKGKTSKQEHLESHNLVDILLDPFPHNGGMTTLESLRMGVPVLSCEKKSPCPTSASILHVLGLDEWRAKDEGEYVDKAVQFAQDVQLLKTLRKQLKGRFEKSVLGDSRLYVREVEVIYRQLWKKWCKKQKA
ncbi:MAG: tetratricopeptide repeat protein, partial [Magnetococcales bacterium]|nr:tetratricopeptide repeat protein [Magnetococcales bacterium]